jgi:L-asparagine transporter-like permease
MLIIGLLTLISIFGLFIIINTIIALRKFPSEDPRRSMSRLPMFPMAVRLIILIALFSVFLGMMTSLSLLNIYQITTIGIFVLVTIWLTYLARRYGWAGQK